MVFKLWRKLTIALFVHEGLDFFIENANHIFFLLTICRYEQVKDCMKYKMISNPVKKDEKYYLKPVFAKCD